MERKSPLESRTLWGGILMLVAMFTGNTVTPEQEAELMQRITELMPDIVGLVGFLLVLFGRTKAATLISWWPFGKKGGDG
jgi:hypothetical protein